MANRKQNKPVLASAQKSGKFSKEERDILDKAIEKFISENYTCSREDAINKLITKRGKNPSILTLIGKTVLPNRPSRSVYSYYRRHLVSHKSGKWSDYEMLILLKAFFQPDSCGGNCWRSVSKALNRSPEQVHDKYREIKPYIQNYKSLITNPDLSDMEKILKIKSITRLSYSTYRNGHHSGKNNPGGSAGLIGKRGRLNKGGRRKDDDEDYEDEEVGSGLEGCTKVSDIVEHQQEIYDFIRNIMNSSRRMGSIEKIPWCKVQEKFPNYSTSKLRIHFNMTLLPKVYKKVFPDFGVNVVSRVTIRWIRKLLKRPNSHTLRSLKDIDFKSKFPMLPVIYTTHCTRRALTKIIRKYQIHLTKTRRLFIESELCGIDVDELNELDPNSLGKIFMNKYIKNIIKFGYNELEIKKWKNHDKSILKSIKKNILPECKL